MVVTISSVTTGRQVMGGSLAGGGCLGWEYVSVAENKAEMWGSQRRERGKMKEEKGEDSVSRL